MKHRAAFIVLALFSAVVILGLSLTSSVMNAYSSSPHATSLLAKSFYLDGKILPDHIAYPVLMIIDRFRLEAASPTEKMYLKTEYANRRLVYATDLYQQNQVDLAISTLTKAQKYLLKAGQYSVSENNTERFRLHLKKTIEYHLRHIERTFMNTDTVDEHISTTDSQRAIIDKLNEELIALHKQL